MGMTRVGIIGATGYTGCELVRILFGHPRVELSILTSETYAGLPYEEVFPALKDLFQGVCEPLDVENVAQRADVIFICLPHTKSMECVPTLVERGKKVFDLSADFRLKDKDLYEEWYAKHTAPELLPKAVYGLPEIHREEIRKAQVVAVPGCYPTGAILGLAPLAATGSVGEGPIAVNAASGVSGAGRSPALESLFCEVNEGMKPYKVAQHRHTPEMEQELSRLAGKEVRVVFVPHLAPMSRGILTTIYVRASKDFTEEELLELYRSFYEGERFVRICPMGKFPNVRDVRGTNMCDIGVKLDPRTGILIIVTAIDNLVKGASGQAVQCMNISLGIEETTGLEAQPLFI